MESTHTRYIVVGPGGWDLSGTTLFVYVNGTNTSYRGDRGDVVPEGQVVTRINQGMLPAGYEVPAWMEAVSLQDYTVPAGSPALFDTVFGAGTVLPAGSVHHGGAVAVQPVAQIDAGKWLDTGFSHYELVARRGIAMLDGASLQPIVPVYRATAQAHAVAGREAGQALELVRDVPLFMENPVTGVLAPRAAASLTLLGGSESGGARSGGGIYLQDGARIAVDPGQRVTLAAGGQVTVDGRIEAPGGAIEVLNLRLKSFQWNETPNGRSVWIGETAVLDAAGRAHTAVDAQGRRYGVVLDGGQIVLGQRGGYYPSEEGLEQAADAFVVVRKGAVLDVSGAQAVLDLPAAGVRYGAAWPWGVGKSPATPVTVASDGGRIAMRSYYGIYNEGTLLAHAGGGNAFGGELVMSLEALWYNSPISGRAYEPLDVGRVIALSQDDLAWALDDAAQAGQAHDSLVAGRASLAAAQVRAGGFDSLSLMGRSAIAFDGDVDLALGRSLTLRRGVLMATTPGARVDLSAPYVLIDGQTGISPPGSGYYATQTVLPEHYTDGSLAIAGELIDVRNRVQQLFDQVTLESRSDLRFLAATAYDADRGDQAASASLATVLAALGDLTLVAGQVYPASGVRAQVYAGQSYGGTAVTGNPSNAYVRDAALTVLPGADGTPAAPYSVFGSMVLTATHILQGGTLRAPLGSIVLGSKGNFREQRSQRIELLPGSITSVSAAGMLIPYGGTADGISYTVDGLDPYTVQALTGQILSSESFVPTHNNSLGVQGIELGATHIVSHAGSVLDLSGGGELLGAAFVAGRGGSRDMLLNPRQPGGQVYAIVPGAQTAPVAGGYYEAWTGDVPDIGRQITLGEGVPGLPAGTYTLMPANYALLHGAFRVELGAQSATAGPGRAARLRDGSYALSGTIGIAGTGVQDALATQVNIAPGQVLRTWSRYNETSYDAWQLSRAATFGTARPNLARDGKFLTLGIELVQGQASYDEPALTFHGDTRMGSDAAHADAYGASLVLLPGLSHGNYSHSAAEFIITAPGSTAARAPGVVPIPAETLNAIGAPNLYIGGAPTINAPDGTVIDFSWLGQRAAAQAVTLESGAVLRGGQVMLVGKTAVTLQEGAGIDTLGWGMTAPDSAQTGYVFGASIPVLAASNGDIVMGTQLRNVAGRITLNDGAYLHTEGSIGFMAREGLVLNGTPRFATRKLELALPALNIGDRDVLAGMHAEGLLPDGMNLDQAMLSLLLGGDPGIGAPAVQRLSLAARDSINFYGDVALSTYDDEGRSLLDALILRTPAIYGWGTQEDAVRLSTDTLVWSGATRTTGTTNNIEYHSAVPGAVLAGGAGTGSGVFEVDARRIVLGYPEQDRPRSEVDFDRLMLGFSTVRFDASSHITANNQGNLSVYQSGPSPVADYDAADYAGSGGRLVLATPMLTGDPGSVFTWRAHDLHVASLPGAAADPALAGQGATLSLIGDTVAIDSAVVLPSGRLVLQAEHDLTLGAQARLDLSGRPTQFFDVTEYGWGGEAVLESMRGNIVMAEGAVIDLSAAADTVRGEDGAAAYRNDAGRLSLAALDEAGTGGRVQLDGTLRAHGGDGFAGGGVVLHAWRIGAEPGNLSADFGALNERLNAAGFTETRRFAFKQGDLTIAGDVLHAREVQVSMDGGSLAVTGRIDASGAAPGVIRLAARDDLTLAGSAVLDVRGTELQVDSYGQPIAAKNRGHVELTSAEGWLRLQAGSRMDLSSPDGASRGQVELNAGRTGETSGDLRIQADNGLAIAGARGIFLNTVQRYELADGSVIDQALLDGYDTASRDFIAAAYGGDVAGGSLSAGLQGKLAGLTAYGEAFHLRPGVEIMSEGDLSTEGDIDLSGYRYGPQADRDPASARYGAGEAMSLVLRAGGDLDIQRSISDGFKVVEGVPPSYEYEIVADITDSPWIERRQLVTGAYAYYSYAGTSLILTRDWTVPLQARVQIQGGSSAPAGTVLPAGTIIESLVGLPEARIVPSDYAGLFQAAIQTSPGVPSYEATSPDAPMLAAGSQSASLRFVAGADVTAALSRSLQAASRLDGSGNMVLKDPRFSTSSPGPSVVRTGTGSLDILAGGDFRQESPYGVYTAGTQVELPTGVEIAPDAYVTDHGGDLRMTVQGDLSGFIYHRSQTLVYNNYAIGQWLQRTGDASRGEPATWAIRFGAPDPASAATLGFSGIGALGGGNVGIEVGGDAGLLEPYGSSTTGQQSQGLVVAVGGSGYVTEVQRNAADQVVGGTLVQTGGGDLSLRVAKRFNLFHGDTMTSPNGTVGDDMNGSLINLRGDIALTAGAIGEIRLHYGVGQQNDPRALDPYEGVLVEQQPRGGPVLVLGDSQARLRSRGDLVLGGVGDAGQVGGGTYNSLFSLWHDDTVIELVSAGGNVAPLVTTGSRSVNENLGSGGQSHVMRMPQILPAQFRAVSASGSLYYGGGHQIMLAPSSSGGLLELLAWESVYGASLPTIASTPAPAAAARWLVSGASSSVNAIPNPFRPHGYVAHGSYGHFFAYQPNLPVAGAAAREPVRIYAVNGDLLNVALGGEGATTYDPVTGTSQTQYIAAGPARLIAGRDIVNFGRGDDGATTQVSRGLILNQSASDVSMLAAGRDIFYAHFAIAGPGTMEVSAGRNIYQGSQASITSIGPIIQGDTRPGADIVIQAGLGAGAPGQGQAAYAALRALYLDPANQADLTPGHPLAEQPGKVAHTYQDELLVWLASRYGDFSLEEATGHTPAAFAALTAEERLQAVRAIPADRRAVLAERALGYFDALAPEQQRIFLRQVYFAELKAGGREYNDASGPRFGSYLRGRQMIATLFPETDGQGEPVAWNGDLTLFQGVANNAGVRTIAGGAIQTLVPGGQTVVGIEGIRPAEGGSVTPAGLLTQGAGEIQMYSHGSILLGLSRIMTTFGGDILAWSATGDINAGRGAKTTVVYTPPRRVYDGVGNATLSPQVPSSGAGIATLNPIPEVPPGDIDLIAPLGTIDAGEAGIRSSGNVNVAALQVVNAANIQAQGESVGVPVVAAVNVGALTNASTAASSAATAAQETVQRTRAQQRQNLPSIINVQILGFGEGGAAGGSSPPAGAAAPDLVQVVDRSALTVAEQRRFGMR